MMTSTLHQAGMYSLEFNSESLGMREITGMSTIRMHSLQEVQQLNSGQLELPVKAGRCTSGNPAVLCLRPGEWLLISETATPDELMKHLQGTIDPEKTAAYDNSDGLAIFRLSGNGAAWLLSKLSGLDYLAGTAAGEHCARTKMGKIAVVVHYHQGADEQFMFDLIFDRSVAKYFWELLSQSAPHADDLALAFGNAA